MSSKEASSNEDTSGPVAKLRKPEPECIVIDEEAPASLLYTTAAPLPTTPVTPAAVTESAPQQDAKAAVAGAQRRISDLFGRTFVLKHHKLCDRKIDTSFSNDSDGVRNQFLSMPRPTMPAKPFVSAKKQREHDARQLVRHEHTICAVH